MYGALRDTYSASPVCLLMLLYIAIYLCINTRKQADRSFGQTLSLVNPERCAGQVICLFAIFIHSHSINVLISLIYSRFSLRWESRKSRIWEMKEDKYTKSLAKNQVYAIVHMWGIRKNVLPKFIKLCMETPCLCPFQGHKYGCQKPTETSVFELSYLCLNSSLEELIKIKVIFILRQGTVQTHIRAFPAAS